MMIEQEVPEFEFSGSHEDIGEQHGHCLASKIEDTLEFYARLFGLRQQELFRIARIYRQTIADFSPEYQLEIEALASAAKVDALWIYALNARSEILNSQVLECTAVYFPEPGILGQNWDWSPIMEQLICLMTIKVANKPLIKMVTEPGIIGKIGMNSEGLGVCLNILATEKSVVGVPVHILLRGLLESSGMDSALALVKRCSQGKASNVLLADNLGCSYNLEFSGDDLYRLKGEGVQCHTNHYLGQENNYRDVNFEGSLDRLHRANELAARGCEDGVKGMQQLLEDRTLGDFSIHSEYHANRVLGEYGTVLTLIMDLKQRILFLKKGSGQRLNYQKTGF